MSNRLSLVSKVVVADNLFQKNGRAEWGEFGELSSLGRKSRDNTIGLLQYKKQIKKGFKLVN